MRFTLCSLAFSSLVCAQGTYVQPPGFEFIEGGGSTGLPFSYVSSRVQQLDGHRTGTPLPGIRGMSFRRDRNAGATGTARTVDVTIYMGKGSLSSFTSTFANNWLATPVTVYTTKPTNLPDITTAPPSFPAPFNITILPYDVMYNYDGNDALLWEVTVDNGLAATYSMDWANGAAVATGDAATPLGTGCTTPNGLMAQTTAFTADTTTLNMRFSATLAPSSAPILLALGVTDPNLPIPGLCTSLRTDALFQIPLGTSSAAGALNNVLVSLPWQDIFVGVSVYTQLIAPDASQGGIPVALSEGRRSPMPPSRGAPAPTMFRRTFNLTSSQNPTGSAPTNTAVATVLRF